MYDQRDFDSYLRPEPAPASWAFGFDVFKAVVECAISLVLFAAALIAASILWKMQ